MDSNLEKAKNSSSRYGVEPETYSPLANPIQVPGATSPLGPQGVVSPYPGKVNSAGPARFVPEAGFNSEAGFDRHALETAYSNSRFAVVEDLAPIALAQDGPLAEKVPVYTMLVEALTAHYRLPEALRVLREVLDLLEIVKPDRLNPGTVRRTVTRTRRMLNRYGIGALANAPALKDPYRQSVMDLLRSGASLASHSDPHLLAVIVCRAVEKLLQHGHTTEAAYWYALFGMVAVSMDSDFATGGTLTRLALDMLAHHQMAGHRTQIIAVTHTFLSHLLTPLAESLKSLHTGYLSRVPQHQRVFSAQCALGHSYHAYVAGIDLERVGQRMAENSTGIGDLKQGAAFQLHEAYRQAVANLQRPTAAPHILVGPFYNEEWKLASHQEAGDRAALAQIHLVKLQLAFLFRNMTDARENARVVRAHLDATFSSVNRPLYYFYAVLTRVARCSGGVSADRNQPIKSIRRDLKALEAWAQQAPDNYGHKYLLAKAEFGRMRGQHQMAVECYEQAIEAAQTAGYVQEAALACELAGRFYNSLGQPRAARGYLREALIKYRQWGALAKVRHLLQAHSELLDSSALKPPDRNDQKIQGRESSEGPECPDLRELHRACQALARAGSRGDVCRQLMEILGAYGGADRVRLFITSAQGLLLQGAVEAPGARVTVGQEQPLDGLTDLAKDVVRYVARKGEPVVLQDPDLAHAFLQDPYYFQRPPQSLLCLPLRVNDRIVGVLYLEAPTRPRAFDESRRQVVDILALQGTLALENIRLTAGFRQADENRRVVKNRLMHLLAGMDQAAEAIAFVTTDGIINYANYALSQMTGLDPQSLVGRTVQDLLPPAHGLADYPEIAAALSRRQGWSGTLRYPHPDEIEVQVELNISLVPHPTGGESAFVAVARDVTREQQLEKELRQAQKMEAIGTLAGGIAHDFNNILLAILGYTELAGLQIGDDEVARHHLDNVMVAGRRAKDLIRQILAFSRQAEQEMQPVELHLLVKEALRLLRATLPTTIEIRQELDFETDLVRVDPTKIHQLLMNLCTNAAHAMQNGGGTLTIGLKSLAAEDVPQTGPPDLLFGPYLVMEVSDTGCGIPADIKEHIFEPFFTTKDPERGTGMGLAVSHGIVKSHGGAITVDSIPDQGSTFMVYLPLYEPPPSGQGLPVESVGQDGSGGVSGHERILLVDDEAALAELGKEMLQDLGYQVTAVSDSAQALAIFTKDPAQFDLLITDQTMPQNTGLQLAHEIMACRPDFPIILTTGYSEQVTAETVEQTGIRALILKPFTQQKLAQTIRNILENN